MKKLLAIFICLMLIFTVFAFASCGGNDGDDGSSAPSTEKSDTSTTDDNTDESTKDSTEDSVDEGGDSSTPDSSENTDVSTDKSTDESTDNSADVNTDASIDNGGSDDEKKEKIFISFRANGSGADFDGATNIEIEKGSALSTAQMPTVTREGYVFSGWTYDPNGRYEWKASDTFDLDTVLYAQWSMDENSSSEQVTVSFTCMGGTYQSGDKEIKTYKGSTISASQMPIYTRNGYVIRWSYDMFGDDMWRASDTFDKNTELYATWIKEDEYFDVITAYLYTIGNVQMNETASVKNGGVLTETVVKYDGQNIYSIMTMVAGSGLGGTSEEYWYVDGIFYSAYGGEKIKTEITPDAFETEIRAHFVDTDRIFQLRKSAVKEITKNGNEYVIEVDAQKYTESLQLGMDVTFERLTMTVTFNENGEISKITSDYAYKASDGALVELVSVSEFTSIGETTVEAPENADEFASK